MRKTWLWSLAGTLALAALSYGLFVLLSPPPLPQGVLYGNGHIEGTEVRVSAEVSGRVVESRLVEGKEVQAGELLLRLDDAEIRARLAQARAEEAAIVETEVSMKAQLGTWQHHLRIARRDMERYRKLGKADAVSRQQLEQVENRLQEANGRVDALKAQLAQSEARLQAAKEQTKLLQLQLDKTDIMAPASGTILLKGIEPGELATPGRVVVVLVDMKQLDLKVYIPEKDIGRIKLGDPARVRISAFPQRLFGGRVSRVDQQAQFTPRDVHMPEERVRMVFGVKLSLDNPEGLLKPGMPADAWILWKRGASWPDRLQVPR